MQEDDGSSRRSWLVGIALVAVMLGLVLGGPASDRAVAAEKGLSVDLTWGTKKPEQQRTAQIVHESGARWVRLTMRWLEVEPRDGVYDRTALATYDRAVALAQQAGVKILVTFYAAPRWARSGSPENSPPAGTARYARVLGFLADRYKGKVNAWEVWNEPNSAGFWSTPNPSAYTELLKAAYPAVKARDARALWSSRVPPRTITHSSQAPMRPAPRTSLT